MKIKIIAEAAQGFEGDVTLAKLLTIAAAKAKADFIKFQLVYADEIATKDYQYYSFFKQLEMSESEWKKVMNVAKSEKIEVLFDVYGEKSLEVAKKLGASGIKISTTDFFNHALLKNATSNFNNIFISIGGIPQKVVEERICSYEENIHITWLYGFQAEPTLIDDQQLIKLKYLREKYPNISLGFMDHTLGTSNEALTLGLLTIMSNIQFIEKHITLDSLLELEDHISALPPSLFSEYVRRIKNHETAMGNTTWIDTIKEKNYFEKAAKVVISKRDLKKGELLKEGDLILKRTNFIKDVNYFYEMEKVIGKELISDLKAETPIIQDKLKKTNKLVAVLACRVNGTRLYGKPLQFLHVEKKITILDHIISVLKKQECIDEIILAIAEGEDNKIFEKVANIHNLPFIIGSETDVLSRLISGAESVGATDVFRITPESPFPYIENLEKIWLKHVSIKADATFVDYLPDGCGFEIITLNALKQSHELGEERHRSEYCSLFLRENSKKFILYYPKLDSALLRMDIRLTVDYPEDLYVCRKVYSEVIERDSAYKLKDIIKFIDEQPLLKCIVLEHVKEGLKNMYIKGKEANDEEI